MVVSFTDSETPLEVTFEEDTEVTSGVRVEAFGDLGTLIGYVTDKHVAIAFDNGYTEHVSVSKVRRVNNENHA